MAFAASWAVEKQARSSSLNNQWTSILMREHMIPLQGLIVPPRNMHETRASNVHEYLILVFSKPSPSLTDTHN